MIIGEVIRAVGPTVLRNVLSRGRSMGGGDEPSPNGSTVTVESPFGDEDEDEDETSSSDSANEISSSSDSGSSVKVSLPSFDDEESPVDSTNVDSTTTQSQSQWPIARTLGTAAGVTPEYLEVSVNFATYLFFTYFFDHYYLFFFFMSSSLHHDAHMRIFHTYPTCRHARTYLIPVYVRVYYNCSVELTLRAASNAYFFSSLLFSYIYVITHSVVSTSAVKLLMNMETVPSHPDRMGLMFYYM